MQVQIHETRRSRLDDQPLAANRTDEPPRYAELAAEARQLNLTLTAIGELHAGDGVTWSLNGKEFAPGVRGWDHFA